MFGWTRRCLPMARPFFLPPSLLACWADSPDASFVVSAPAGRQRASLFWVSICLLLLTYTLTVLARLLEIPYWDNPSYQLGSEYLLATHDAYHWIAGAEGFEFGVGHPMSELVRGLSEITGASPADVGFWLPPFMGGFVAVAVFLWAAGLGHPFAGFVAGVLASLSPSFFARTLLGFCDTDLVVLLFSVFLGLVPAMWLHPWLVSLPDLLCGTALTRWKRKAFTALEGEEAGPSEYFFRWMEKKTYPLHISLRDMERDILAWPWLLALILAGVFGYWAQEWHSFFPYLIRFSAVVLPFLIAVLGPQQGRTFLLEGALCHIFPLLLGPTGVGIALVYSFLLKAPLAHFKEIKANTAATASSLRSVLEIALRVLSFRRNKFVLLGLWGVVLFLCLDSTVFELMRNSYRSYVHRAGDSVALASDALLFPSVASSIIEVQRINFAELLSYFYPGAFIPLLSFLAFCIVLLLLPVLIWFLPLIVLAFMSLYMGGRMTMFAPPGLMLALAISGGWCIRLGWAWCKQYIQSLPDTPGVRCVRRWQHSVILPFVCSFFLAGYLSWPLITLIPDYTQGPIISKEQAMGLAYLKDHSPEDAVVWNWWDWGYATHHFSRRATIADGARHGGASLYLPAVVYTTADARFARQVIKHTALKGNVPGYVFAGLSPQEAQGLMVSLGDKKAPLITAPGKQYVVVSFEHLRLGLWVTRYGSWNFERKSGAGAIMNNIYQGLEYEPETGSVTTDGGPMIEAASIDIFAPSGIRRYTYPGRRGNHFIFNLQNHTDATELIHKTNDSLMHFWEWQRGSFRFTAPVSDKMVVDPIFYNTMMVQLLLGKKDDPRIQPYFKCVFDNVYARVFEVL